MERNVQRKVEKVINQFIYGKISSLDDDYSIDFDKYLENLVIETTNAETYDELIRVSDDDWGSILVDAHDVRDNNQPLYFEKNCKSKIEISLIDEETLETIEWEYRCVDVHDWFTKNSDFGK